MQNLADLRKEYTKASLDTATVLGDPILQFEQWFEQALKTELMEPNAMTLSTINEAGRPTARIVLLKGIEKRRFVFYTNYQSQKGRQLEKNPACALTFFWPELERQVRIEGIAERVDAELSDAYFQSRPRGSQVGAWSSPQSSIIKDRAILEERIQQIEKRFEGHDVLPRPHQWGGFGVDPVLFEFWQGGASRLHDRILYTLVDGKWTIHRMAP